MKLKKIEVNSFGGIHPDSPVIIDFSDSNFVVAKGDNGVGKTSLLNALLVACGQLSKENKNFINNETGKIDINFDFVGKDRCTYQVRCTKSIFSLTYEGVAVPEPITKMKELLGVVGVSPMDIKNKPLKEIVKWLSTYSNKNPEDFEKELSKHKANIKTAEDTRASANRSAKGLNEFLQNEPLFTNWEDSEKKYTKAVDIKELSKKLSDAGNKSDKYIRAEEKVKGYQSDHSKISDEIERIRLQLAEKELELRQVEEMITQGNKYLVDHAADKKEYEIVKAEYDNAAEENAMFNKWQEVKAKKKEKDEFEDISQKADATIQELNKKVKDLQAEILPDIKGVALYTSDTVEDGKSIKEGLYWNGKNAAQLSESEWWTLVMQIWRKYKVKVIVIDNMQSLGTMGVDILQKLAKDGAYILAAEMDRKTKELKISYE